MAVTAHRFGVANPMTLVVTILSDQSVICSVYTSHFSISSARLEPQPKWYCLSEPYCAVPCSGKAPKRSVSSRTEPYHAVEKRLKGLSETTPPSTPHSLSSPYSPSLLHTSLLHYSLPPLCSYPQFSSPFFPSLLPLSSLWSPCLLPPALLSAPRSPSHLRAPSLLPPAPCSPLCSLSSLWSLLCSPSLLPAPPACSPLCCLLPFPAPPLYAPLPTPLSFRCSPSLLPLSTPYSSSLLPLYSVIPSYSPCLLPTPPTCSLLPLPYSPVYSPSLIPVSAPTLCPHSLPPSYSLLVSLHKQ